MSYVLLSMLWLGTGHGNQPDINTTVLISSKVSSETLGISDQSSNVFEFGCAYVKLS